MKRKCRQETNVLADIIRLNKKKLKERKSKYTHAACDIVNDMGDEINITN